MEDDFAKYVEYVLARQDLLWRNVPRCPSCGTEQVQLIKTEPPAVWKCRKCKNRWGFEPDAIADEQSAK